MGLETPVDEHRERRDRTCAHDINTDLQTRDAKMVRKRNSDPVLNMAASLTRIMAVTTKL